MPISTCPPPEQLLAFMLGKLPDDVSETVAGHLDDCTACDRVAASLESMSDSFVAGLRRPTGDGSFLGEQAFQSAARVIASLGQNPTDVGVDRDEALADPEIVQLGQYRLLEVLGHGGMGTVYKALHARLEKIVALKVLPPERIADDEAVARFDREIKAVGRLDHANIVRAMDAGEVEGMHYLVMEYVDGIDLARLVRRRGPLPIAESCEVIRQAALGLDAAHRRGMVHRDIKPSNLMVTNPSSEHAPTVKVLDLGLALLSDVQRPAGPDLTGSGQLMGTLDYMAPEQGGDSHDVDIRADIYSLGATLYKLLTGESIYHSPQYRTQLQRLNALANELAPPIQSRRSDVPDELAALVHRMIAKNAEDRFGTPAEVAAALEPFAREANLARLLDDNSGAVGERSSAAPERPTSATGASVTIPPTAVPAKPSNTRRGNGVMLIAAGAIAVGLIGIILAAVFVFRTPEGTVTVEIGDAYRQDISLLVTGGGETLKISDKSGWTINLAEGKYDVALSGSDDQFELDQDTVTVRRGETVTVRVTRKPKPVAPNSPAEQALAWIVENNSLGPDHKFVEDARKQIAALGQTGRGFAYHISGELLKSGKPTLLAVHGNKMIAFEVSPEQAKLMGIVDTPMVGFRGGPLEVGKRAEKPEFELTELRLNNEEALGQDGLVAGSIDFKRLRPPDKPGTQYSVRAVYMFDRAMATIQVMAGDLAVDKGTVRLENNNLLPKEWKDPAVMAMFLELGTVSGPKDFEDFIALSDPIGTVIVLHPAETEDER